jgi:regulatory protein PHO2
MAQADYVVQEELPRHTTQSETPNATLDSSPSPVSSSSQSPAVGSVRPSSASPSDSNDADIGKLPSSGPQRSKSISGTGGKWEREKRKRSRVTPEQLIHLERFFSMDRSPTAARRKEISDLLGMQERQTQIWFQNRSVTLQ